MALSARLTAIAERAAASSVLRHPLGTPADRAVELQSVVPLVRGAFARRPDLGPDHFHKEPRSAAWARSGYSPMVRMTLFSGRVLLEDSLSSCASISSYFGTVVTSPFGTMCTTL